MRKVDEKGIENYAEDIAGGLTMNIRVETSEYGKEFRASVTTEGEDGKKRVIVTFTGEKDNSLILGVVKDSGLTDEQLKDLFAKCADIAIELKNK